MCENKGRQTETDRAERLMSWCSQERNVVNLQQWVLNKLSSLERIRLQVVSQRYSSPADACEIVRYKQVSKIPE